MSDYVEVTIEETCDDHPDVQLERLAKILESDGDGWNDDGSRRERTKKTITVTCWKCKIESKHADWDAE